MNEECLIYTKLRQQITNYTQHIIKLKIRLQCVWNAVTHLFESHNHLNCSAEFVLRICSGIQWTTAVSVLIFIRWTIIFNILTNCLFPSSKTASSKGILSHSRVHIGPKLLYIRGPILPGKPITLCFKPLWVPERAPSFNREKLQLHSLLAFQHKVKLTKNTKNSKDRKKGA